MGREFSQERVIGEAAPFVAIESFVAGGADAAFDGGGVSDTAKDDGQPVTHFNPGVSGGDDRGVGLEAMPELGPEPLGGVSVAAFGNVLGPMVRGEGSDPGRLPPARMILPQPAVRVEIFRPLRVRDESTVLSIDRERTGAGGIDANTDDLGGFETTFAGGDGQGALGGDLEAVQVVERVLSGHVVVLGVEKDALMAGRTIDHPGASRIPCHRRSGR